MAKFDENIKSRQKLYGFILTCSWYNGSSFIVLTARIENAWLFIRDYDVCFIECFEMWNWCMRTKGNGGFEWQSTIWFWWISWKINVIGRWYFGYSLTISKLQNTKHNLLWILFFSPENSSLMTLLFNCETVLSKQWNHLELSLCVELSHFFSIENESDYQKYRGRYLLNESSFIFCEVVYFLIVGIQISVEKNTHSSTKRVNVVKKAINQATIKWCIYGHHTRLSMRLRASHMAAPSTMCALCIDFCSVGFFWARMNITGDGFSWIADCKILL